MLKLPKKVRQYGLMRSGTNYTQFIIESNYHVEVLFTDRCAYTGKILGGKHGGHITRCKHNTILTTKHPLSWFISCFRMLHKISNTRKEQFMSIASYCYADETQKKQNFLDWFDDQEEKFCNHWNIMNNHWISIKNIEIIKYEDLIESPESTITKIANTYGWDRKTNNFYAPINKMDCEGKQLPNVKFDLDYYLQKKYKKEFSKKNLEVIRNNLDPKLMKQLNYQI
jgi:hypothetical protein